MSVQKGNDEGQWRVTSGSFIQQVTPARLAPIVEDIDELMRLEMKEPVLHQPPSTRYTLFPIKHHRIWELHKLAEASFWTTAALDLAQDPADYRNKLTEGERKCLNFNLGFFAGADGVVLDNLIGNFCSEVQIMEAKTFFGFQACIEGVHSETYSLLINELVPEADERKRLFEAVETMPAVRAKVMWAIKYMDPRTQPFAVRVVAFAILEGIFFSSAFASVFYFGTKNVLKGLLQANEYILRDEAFHFTFGCMLFNMLQYRPGEQTVRGMIEEAIAIERDFAKASLDGTQLVGLDAEKLNNYAKVIADCLLVNLGYSKMYNATNTISYMNTFLGVEGHDNFYEKEVTEYRKAVLVSPDKKAEKLSKNDLDLDDF